VVRKTSRKRRRERGAARPARPASSRHPASPNGGKPPDGAAAAGAARGYTRSRAKDEAARAALKPLRPGERPTAVTVGAAVAAVLAVANLVALVVGWDTGPGSGSGDSDEDGRAVAGSLLVTAVLAVVAVGMWRAGYWAVLGMQTLLAITIVFASLGLITATSAWAAILLVLIIAGAGTLFWFMVKAMARIQMPERPGAHSRGR
jgi:hypothetical protein